MPQRSTETDKSSPVALAVGRFIHALFDGNKRNNADCLNILKIQDMNIYFPNDFSCSDVGFVDL